MTLQQEGNNYIGRQLARKKRDLIGWNRVHAMVHQYLQYNRECFHAVR